MLKALFLLLGVASCDVAMLGMGDMGSMRAGVEDMRLETSRHRDAVITATTMPNMRSEMDRHRSAMTTMMADVDMTMDDMAGHCGGTAFADMTAMHDTMDGEWANHMAAMNALSDVPAATAEVQRHVNAMLEMMDRMERAMGSMMCH